MSSKRGFSEQNPKQLSFFSPPERENVQALPPQKAGGPVLLGLSPVEELPPVWAEFVRGCRSCHACGLAETRDQVVVGRGGIGARLVFIGEAPGAEEDRTGLPFVGRSGRLLQELLEERGLRREDYHIMNTVRCRPPENRVPTPEELAACRPWFLEQLRLLGARVVVTLGATAYRACTGDKKSSITRIRGLWQWREDWGVWLLPSLHPAYILRCGSQKPKLEEDLDAAVERLRRLGDGSR